MNAANAPQSLFGNEVGSYYDAPDDPSLIEDLQAVLQRLAVNSGTLFPDDAKNFNFIGNYAVGITSVDDVLVYAFLPESPLNPAVPR